MLSSIIDAFKVPELRKKILFTLAILALYRFGAYVPVNVGRLDEKFAAGETVNGETLVEKGIIKHPDALVKVLGDGEITKALTIKVDKVSASAKAKIEAAGGKVE